MRQSAWLDFSGIPTLARLVLELRILSLLWLHLRDLWWATTPDTAVAGDSVAGDRWHPIELPITYLGYECGSNLIGRARKLLCFNFFEDSPNIQNLWTQHDLLVASRIHVVGGMYGAVRTVCCRRQCGWWSIFLVDTACLPYPKVPCLPGD